MNGYFRRWPRLRHAVMSELSSLPGSMRKSHFWAGKTVFDPERTSTASKHIVLMPSFSDKNIAL